MNLQLAIILSCARNECQLRRLSDQAALQARCSAPMIERGIVPVAGDLAAVDLDTDPRQIVFRWALGRVERKDELGTFVRFPDGDLHPVSMLAGVSAAPVVGDEVFVANGQICSTSVVGVPAQPQLISTTFFPMIQTMYKEFAKR